MRALLPLLLVTLAAHGQCIDPAVVAAGPRSIQTQCSYWKADIAAQGSHVVAAWMTSVTSGFTPNTTGTTAGGILDGRGKLVSAEQIPMNEAPGYPSVATNGQLSLLAWSRTRFGTYFQFLGADGARIGQPVRISETGLNHYPPRALWNGREWRVAFTEGPDVLSVRVEADGTVADRKVVAGNATLAAGQGDRIVVSTTPGFLLITPSGTQPLSAIPAGAVVAIGDRLLAWHAGAIGVQRLPDGNPAVIANASIDVQNIAVAGDVVLWNDVLTTLGAYVNADGSTRAIATLEGRLQGAAETSEGAVALVSGPCHSVTSRFLPRGAAAFAEPEVVSRATVGQTPHAIVPTPRGHHVVWSEPRPVESGAHLFITQVEGFQARPPVVLSTALGVRAVAAAPLAGGSVIVWADRAGGLPPEVVKYARVDAGGQLRGAPAEIASAWFIQEMAVAARGEEIVVFTVEHATYAWIGDLWRTTIDASGAVTRELLAADVDGWALDAAQTSEGIVASWYDYVGDADSLRLTVRDPGATRTFSLPLPLQSVALIGGTTPLVLWRKASDTHALFPRSGVDVVAAAGGEHGIGVMDAAQQSDGSFNVAVAPYDPTAAHVRIVNVMPAGVVTPREELCFGVPASLLSMRGETVDAIVTRLNGGVFVAKRPPPRRRAMR
ncbi:MAG TPA: hypothetical protein VF432_12190 [Thermoanaerobaculia bacterium]